nr:hypothetical protein L204_02085 [Cryptococcus depauperatus CBS 7855]
MSESDQTRSKIIQDHPIANGLDTFRATFRPQIATNIINLRNRRDLQDITSSLLSALQIPPVSRLLQSEMSTQYTVQDDILRLEFAALSDDFDFDCIRSLLEIALSDNPEDALIWDLVAAHVARHYYHTTVRVGDKNDDVLANIRQGIDLSEAVHSRLDRPKKATAISSATGMPSQSRSSSSSTGVKASVKRPFSETSLSLPPSKRSIQTSQTKASIEMLSNRVHRRIILCDYGKAIYKASSRVALLAAMERCIAGHESLLQAGFLHRDISINNLMIDEDNDNAFLIDLDLAIRVPRIGASGVKGMTGTRAFMAIGVLEGDEHSFMHDLESFFWVLFWICIHYDGPGKPVSSKYDRWNYKEDFELAGLKLVTISSEEIFLDATGAHFTPFYQPLIPLMNKIRKEIFPNGKWRMTENRELYSLIKEILANGQKDPKILGVSIS